MIDLLSVSRDGKEPHPIGKPREQIQVAQVAEHGAHRAELVIDGRGRARLARRAKLAALPAPGSRSLLAVVPSVLMALLLVGCSNPGSGGRVADPEESVDADRTASMDASALEEGPARANEDANSADTGRASSETGGISAAAGGAELSGKPKFCARGAEDAVTRIFCAAQNPSINGMSDLLDRMPDDGRYPSSAFAIGHSTALGGHLVSAINPRIIRTYGNHSVLANAPGVSAVSAVLAFVRGEQRVELAARDRKGRLNFYLLEFEQACNGTVTGCTPGELFTGAIEADWLDVAVRDDEELKDTPLDCRRCHGGSPGEPGPMLLMRELRAPWMHWFGTFAGLTEDFLQARGSHIDLIAGVRPAIPGHPFPNVASLDGFLVPSDPSLLETLVDHLRSPPQPLPFPGSTIAFETREEMGLFLDSPTWRALYNDFRNGRALAPPYQFSRVTDPTKLSEVSRKYRAFLDGQLPRADVPDLREVFPDDPQVRAEMGLAVESGATGPELLTQACAPCHNDRLDQTLSRARFNATSMTRGQIEVAIERLSQPADSPTRMPPSTESRTLDEHSRARLITFLRSVSVSPALDDGGLLNPHDRGILEPRDAGPLDSQAPGSK